VSERSSEPPALERFLRSLAARDASPHTIRAYRTAIGAYLDWLAEHDVEWTRPARHQLRGYLAHLGSDASRSTVAQRLAAIRSFHRWAARDGLTTGDPWGAIATPRLPRRLHSYSTQICQPPTHGVHADPPRRSGPNGARSRPPDTGDYGKPIPSTMPSVSENHEKVSTTAPSSTSAKR
jgi:hypothetical protein